MEMKTNRENLDILKFLIILAEIVPSMEIQ